MPPPTAATSESLACGAHFLRGLLQRLVSLAAVFWMSRNAPQAFRDIQKRLRGRLFKVTQYNPSGVRPGRVSSIDVLNKQPPLVDGDVSIS